MRSQNRKNRYGLHVARRALIVVTALLTWSLFGPLLAAGAQTTTINAQTPVAVGQEDCSFTVSATADFKPPSGMTEADFYFEAPGAIGFTFGITKFPGPGGHVVATLASNAGSPGTWAVRVHWTGTGLAYLGVAQDSPVATFTVPDCSGPPPPPPPLKPNKEPGYIQSQTASRDHDAVAAGILCTLGVIGGGILIFTTAGTLTPAVAWVAGTVGGGCLVALAGTVGAEWGLNHDPPDSDYHDVPVPLAPSLPEVPSSCARTITASACSALLSAERSYKLAGEQKTAVLYAEYTQSNRYATALAAKDPAAVFLQNAAIKTLAGEEAAALHAQSKAGETLANAIEATGQKLGPIDFPTFAGQIEKVNWNKTLSDAAGQYLVPLGLDNDTVAKEITTLFKNAVDQGVHYTDLRALLTYTPSTTGFTAIQHSLTSAEVSTLIGVLTDQEDIPADLGANLQHDIGTYNSTGCATSLATDSALIPDDQTQQFITTAIDGLPVNCHSTPPVITSVDPDTGPQAGGNTIVLHGKNLASITEVDFGDNNPAPTGNCSLTTCDVVAPGGSGQVVITAINDFGRSPETSAARYIYVAGPPGPKHLPVDTLLRSGGFEPPGSVLVDDFQTIDASGAALLGPGWAISQGTSVDLVGPEAGQAAEGTQFIDLDGNDNPDSGAASSETTLSQRIDTHTSHRYRISFELSGNPNGDPVIKTLAVWFGKTSKSFSFDTSKSGTDALAWKGETFYAEACSTTTQLSFISTTPGIRGPLLDSIAVQDLGPAPGCASSPTSSAPASVVHRTVSTTASSSADSLSSSVERTSKTGTPTSTSPSLSATGAGNLGQLLIIAFAFIIIGLATSRWRSHRPRHD